MIQIKTQDNKLISIDKELALKSNLLKNLINDLGDENVEIPVNNINFDTFEIVLKYLENKHVDLLSELDRDQLIKLTLAANYLDIENLLDDSCKKIADNIKGKPVEYIKNYIGIELKS